MIGVTHVRECALCASSTSRRAWGDGLHHILDPRTGAPARAVVADDAALPDGLATALFFTDPERLDASFRFSYVRMLADGRAQTSRDFQGELFT